jgi:hypothetical protein
MFETKSSPRQILNIWEAKYGKLRGTQKAQFLQHEVTLALCQFEPKIISFAVEYGSRKYLEEIFQVAKERSKAERTFSHTKAKPIPRCSYCQQLQNGIYCLCDAA